MEMNQEIEDDNFKIPLCHPLFEKMVDELKTMKACDLTGEREDYSDFKVDKERAAALIEIVEADGDGFSFREEDFYWVPVHAWRILSAKKVEASIPVLIDRLSIGDGDEWVMSELPSALEAFGTIAIPFIVKYLGESPIYGSEVLGTVGLLEALTLIGKKHLEKRPLICRVMIDLLKDFEVNPIDLNSFLIWDLLELSCEESLPLIQTVFTKQFVDETIIDWDIVREEIGGKVDLPASIKFDNGYPRGFTEYSGDKKFQKILRTLDSRFNVDRLKCYLLGTFLGVELVPPSVVLEDVLTDTLGSEIEFGSDGQRDYFFKEFFGLFNEVMEFQDRLFPLPVCFKKISSNESDTYLKIFKLEDLLSSFKEGLEVGQVSDQRLDRVGVEFLGWLEDSILSLDELRDLVFESKPEDIDSRLEEIVEYWNKNFLLFAAECRNACLKRHEQKQFIATHRGVGRNEPCPCGSGKKYKKCCNVLH